MNPKQIILATRNQGKIAELAKPLADFGIEVSGLDAWPQIGEIEENGSTFAQNALIKAAAIAQKTGLIAVADDSGLMVDILHGAPGVYSARYSDDWPALAGESRDSRNIRKLLHNLEGIIPHKRTARFATAMAAVAPEGQILEAEGLWEGLILTRPVGSNGFGYDPVFYDPALNKSAAQLSREEKFAVSHRGKALRALLKAWPDFMASLGK